MSLILLERRIKSMRLRNVLLLTLVAILLVILLYRFRNEEPEFEFTVPANMTDKSKFVFFDLGANKGDSLANFFGLETSGGGGNINSIIPKKFIQNNFWIAHVYEANPFFDSRLLAVKKRIPSRHKVFMNNRTAAWIYDGEIEFYLDTFAEAFDSLGSSIKREHKDAARSNFTKIAVKCHRISRILKQYSKDDFIIMKIDIEGAEYELFIDFLQQGVLGLIDYIALEYHDFVQVFKTADEVFDRIIQAFGIKKVNWI